MEHILLTSDSDAELAIDGQPGTDSRRTEGTFRQFSRSKGYRASYEIFNSHYLEVRIRSVHGTSHRYTVNLAFLSPRPLRRVVIAWRILGAAVLAAFLTAVLVIYIGDVDEPLLVNPWLPVAIVTGTLAVVVGLFGLHRCSDRLMFFSEHGDVLFFELLNKGRRNREFQSFAQTIIDRIQVAQGQRRASDGPSQLVAELREHRRLKEASIISEEEYQRARARILQYHG